jgi:hypothetical protein
LAEVLGMYSTLFFPRILSSSNFLISKWLRYSACTVGRVDIGTRTKVPLEFLDTFSKITKINEKSVLTL